MLKQIIEKIEEAKETDYQKYFNAKLKKWKISAPTELSKKDKKDFFDEVDKDWDAENETD